MDRNQSTLARKSASASRDVPANRPPEADRTTARKTGRIREHPARQDLSPPRPGQQRGHGVATKTVERQRPMQQGYARVGGGGQAVRALLRKQVAPVRPDRGPLQPLFGVHQASSASASLAAKTVILPLWVNNDDVSSGKRRHRDVHDIGGRTGVLPAHNIPGRRRRVDPEDIGDGRWVIGPDMSIRRVGMVDQADNHDR